MSRQIGQTRQKYSTVILEEAAGLVRTKSISLNQAAKKYGVPKTTLQNAVHYKYGGHKVGHKTVLTEHEERRIADWAIHMARIGYGRTRRELANTVKKILDDDGRTNPFKDNKPGKEWLSGFFKRHAELSIRTTIQLGKERAIISAEKINKWFEDFRAYIENEVGDSELLSDPSRIYNADESGVSLCMKGIQVIGIKGAPVVYHYGNSDKTQLTIMAACSATGHYVQPMIIFPGQRFSYNPLDGFEEAALGRSDTGWMDSEVFCNWLENVFIPAVNERHVKKPILLLIDGHSTHVTMEASNMCIQNGVELYCLLEHASHVLQPLDLRLFSSLKKSWRQAVRDWQSDNVGQYVTKQTFARVFKKAWMQSTTIEAAVKGFQEAGLFPLDPSIITKSVKLEPSKIFHSLNSPSTNVQHPNTSLSILKEHENTEDNTTVKCSQDNAESDDNSKVQNIETASATDIVHQTQTSENREDEPTNQTTQQTPMLENEPTNKEISHPSPFSKHLVMPTPKTVPGKSKVVRRICMPKAITGSAYRKLMEEKRARKEEEEKEKERRKREREHKRKLKEDEKVKRKTEVDAKRRKRAEDKQKKRELREKLLKSLEESDGDSDNAMDIDRNKCYTCEKTYSTDYIECVLCLRRFHIECVADDYLTCEGLPFECKYC